MAVKQAAAPVRQRVPIRRDNFVAGGICPEGDYDVKSSRIVNFAYASADGKTTGVVTCAHQLKMQPVNSAGEPDGLEVDQHYSVGDIKAFAPSEDGSFIEMVGTRSQLSNQSNFYIAYNEMCAAGVPEALLEEQGVSILEGARVHIAHIPAPDRTSLQQRNAAAAGTVTGMPPANQRSDQPKTIPVIKRVLSAPWDKKGGKPSAKPAAAAPAASSNGGSAAAGADNRLANFFQEVIKKYNGDISLTAGKLQVMKLYNKAQVETSVREAEMAVIDDDKAFGDILASVNCELEDGTLKLIA